jgi:hypothetical protein
MSFPPGNKMFQFPGYRLPYGITEVRSAGFPHSEINGSMLVYNSPSLIAANHVLLRLSMPGHPPYALTYLTILLLGYLTISNFLTSELSLIPMRKLTSLWHSIFLTDFSSTFHINCLSTRLAACAFSTKSLIISNTNGISTGLQF